MKKLTETEKEEIVKQITEPCIILFKENIMLNIGRFETAWEAKNLSLNCFSSFCLNFLVAFINAAKLNDKARPFMDDIFSGIKDIIERTLKDKSSGDNENYKQK